MACHPDSSPIRDRILACLSRYDLEGLIRMGAPWDEYTPEVPRILDWFTLNQQCDDVIQAATALHDVFVAMFGAGVAHEEVEHYQEAAQELLSIWQKWQEEQKHV